MITVAEMKTAAETKITAEQFAIFGGVPLFSEPLHVGQPVLSDREQLLADFDAVMQSGQLTNHGPKVREFESTVACMTSVRHCIATCNATIALQIAARAMGLTGEVIMPAFTFIATAHAMEWIGLTPVFADVDPATHTLDADSAEACITSRTSAILPVHLWGHVCRPEQFASMCKRHGLRLLFDSSHAFGCQSNGVSTGAFGDAEVFSFHATKFIHAFEGGAIMTNDDQLAERCRRLRAFGISGLTEVSDVGTNGKMHELSAAAGLRSIKSMPAILTANTDNRRAYADICDTVSGLSLTPVPRGNFSNNQYLVFTLDEHRFGLSRDQLVSILRAEGVFARSYFAPGCHRSEPYRSDSTGRHVPVPLPVSEQLLNSVLQLPTGMAVSVGQIRQIGRLIASLHRTCHQIQRLWSLCDGRVKYHHADAAAPRNPTPPVPAFREAG